MGRGRRARARGPRPAPRGTDARLRAAQAAQHPPRRPAGHLLRLPLPGAAPAHEGRTDRRGRRGAGRRVVPPRPARVPDHRRGQGALRRAARRLGPAVVRRRRLRRAPRLLLPHARRDPDAHPRGPPAARRGAPGRPAGRAGPRGRADRPLHPRAAPARPRRQRARGAVAQRADPAGAGGRTTSRTGADTGRDPSDPHRANPHRGTRENNDQRTDRAPARSGWPSSASATVPRRSCRACSTTATPTRPPGCPA